MLEYVSKFVLDLYISYAFLPPGFGSASVHADPDPGGIFYADLRPDPKHWLTVTIFLLFVYRI